MNLMIVAVAFASFSAVQGDGNMSRSGGDVGTPVARPEAPQAAGPGVNQAEVERPVCRRLVTSGSNRARRICMTAEQWRRQDQ